MKKIKLPFYKYRLAQWLEAWMETNERLRIINKHLYEHTEYYENKYEWEFEQELHNFFAKKITRFSKEIIELYKILDDMKYSEEIKTKILEIEEELRR